MMEWLLKFCGAWPRGAEKLVGIRPLFRSPMHPAFCVLAWVLATVGIWWLYRRESGNSSVFKRVMMAACRAVLVLLIVMIIMQPVIEVTTGASVRETLVVLVDASSSMQLADRRDRAEDQHRAALVLDAANDLGESAAGAGGANAVKTLNQAPARLDLVKAALKSRDLDLFARLSKDFRISVFEFDRNARELELEAPGGAAGTSPASWIDRLQAQGNVTALGDAIHGVLVAERGQALGGIWVISDGASNTGLSLSSAAQLAKDEKVPIYCYGVGTTAPKDIQVSAILAPDMAFVHNEVPLTVRVRSQGYVGQHAELVLKMDGTPIVTKDVVFDADGEQMISMTLTPDKVGSFMLEAGIAPRPDEVVADNNTSPPKRLRVVDSRIKVLQIEQRPRWEFKYLQAMLMRDRRVDYHCWLVEADPGVTADSGTSASPQLSPYLAAFPTRKEDLLQYDLVILGDVDPRQFPAGALDQINTFVANTGGGLIMIAGPSAAPLAYRRTPIEKMLPVELDLATGLNLAGDGEHAIHLEMTAAGKSSAMLHLGTNDAENIEQWTHLPPVYWTARVPGAKPAAEVLVVDPDAAKATRFGKMPVIALQQYGLGQVLYVGTDNTWRWRRNGSEDVFDKLWGRMIERVALPHVLGLSSRTQLSFDHDKYSPGDRVIVFGRLYSEGEFAPVTDTVVKAYYSHKGQPGDAHDVALHAMPDQPGVYRGQFIAPGPGEYQFWAQTEPQRPTEFTVADTRIELGETALNEAGLRELAQNSGGVFTREEGLHRLPEQMRHTTQPVLSTVEMQLWSSPMVFAAALSLAAVEWWMRKRAQLK